MLSSDLFQEGTKTPHFYPIIDINAALTPYLCLTIVRYQSANYCPNLPRKKRFNIGARFVIAPLWPQ